MLHRSAPFENEIFIMDLPYGSYNKLRDMKKNYIIMILLSEIMEEEVEV